MLATRPTLARLATLAIFTLLLAPAAALAAPTTSNEKAAALLEAKAASVVQVKVVLRMLDRENTFTYQGTVVDPSGMILTPNFSSGFRGVKTTVVSIRVIFAGDEKEHDAVLGAFDSKLGLGFVRLKDTTGLKLSSVDFGTGADPTLGQELFGVLRMDEGFDYAPYFGITTIVGQVQKPRAMWVPQGFLPYAAPLYHLDGRVAGVVIRQEGISESGSGQRNFLLPVEATKAVVSQAVKACCKALEDAKTLEAEGAEAGMADEGGMAEGAGMEDAPAMDDAPAGMDE
ncbi:MAG TPA: hypothetical protein VND21_06850 [Planctomycetota bacterium]|jgi:hypothetical protein|nr:hypothetical protein [Planctomycetota bacterium]